MENKEFAPDIITLIDDEGVEQEFEIVDSMEFEDGKSLLEEFGEDEVRFWMIQDKVIDFLVDQAMNTEIETEQYQEDDLE